MEKDGLRLFLFPLLLWCAVGTPVSVSGPPAHRDIAAGRHLYGTITASPRPLEIGPCAEDTSSFTVLWGEDGPTVVATEPRGEAPSSAPAPARKGRDPGAGTRAGDGKPGKSGAQATLVPADLARIRKEIASRHGSPLLVNFWAVWCHPCVEELPDLASIETRFASSGVGLLGVACDLMLEDDSPALRRTVVTTLEKSGAVYSNLLYAGDGDVLIRAFDLPGPIPHSILFGADGKEIKRWTGRLPLADLEAVLGRIRPRDGSPPLPDARGR